MSQSSAERTVSLRRPGAFAGHEEPAHTESKEIEFDIEVPPHLAQEFGLTIFPPPSPRIIRCSRPARIIRRAA